MPEIDFNIFRRNLKTVRNAQGRSAKDLAIAAKLRQQKRIADIEEGRGKPTIEEIYSICAILHHPIDKMMNMEAYIAIEYKEILKR